MENKIVLETVSRFATVPRGTEVINLITGNVMIAPQNLHPRIVGKIVGKSGNSFVLNYLGQILSVAENKIFLNK